ncbi:UNVERIFIED_CONTAM: hypothetical protein Slati_0488500 [Sesamum latifolium]|uniref:Uncharacterized protein n=1 Tax=Sesamum latifolium TaxID=2727402 RepID=A0AAW2XXW8_9LAMI
MLSQEKEGPSSRAIDILKGTVPPADKRLMSSLSWEDLDRMLSLVLVKAAALKGELLSRPLGEPAHVHGDAHRKKLEDQVERLLGEVTKRRDAKKEAVGRYQQAERG